MENKKNYSNEELDKIYEEAMSDEYQNKIYEEMTDPVFKAILKHQRDKLKIRNN